jgi:hypothetical protein
LIEAGSIVIYTLDKGARPVPDDGVQRKPIEAIFRVLEVRRTKSTSAVAGAPPRIPRATAYCELLGCGGKMVQDGEPIQSHRFRLPVEELRLASILYQLAGA